MVCECEDRTALRSIAARRIHQIVRALKKDKKVLEGMKARVGGNPKDHEYWDADEGFSANDVGDYFDELVEDRETGAVPADLDSAE